MTLTDAHDDWSQTIVKDAVTRLMDTKKSSLHNGGWTISLFYTITSVVTLSDAHVY